MIRIPSLAAAALFLALLPGCFPYALSTSAPMVHITLYKFKQGTPITVTEDFLRDAQNLVPIPVVKGLWAGRPATPPAQFQPVAIQDYDIGLAVMVEHAQALEEYFTDQRHRTFAAKYEPLTEIRVIDFTPRGTGPVQPQ